MPLPPSHSNFYDNEDDESDYDSYSGEGDTYLGHTRRKKSRVQYHGDHDFVEPRTARFTDVGSPVVYPDTPTGRAMVERLNRNYHPDNPKYYVKGDTPAEREKERAKRLSFGGSI